MTPPEHGDGGGTLADWTSGTPQLVLRRCRACLHLWYLPRQRCARCGAEGIDAVVSDGRGMCVASTVSHLAADAPVGIALVMLDEGPLVMGRTASTGQPVEPGDVVTMRFVSDGDAAMLPTFAPVPTR